MSETKETLADIVAEMRERADYRALYPDEIIEWADRIEAAWKVERRILVSDAENAKDARNHMGIKLRQEFADKCKECVAKVGNAAKLREALFEIRRMAGLYPPIRRRAFAIAATKALAAQLRNCDRFADIPGDAICAWLKEDPAARRMTNEEQNAASVFAMWAFGKEAET